MIEPTDEMVDAYAKATGINWAHLHVNHRLGLAAVLTIVARDHRTEPRIRTRCDVPGPDGMTCQRSPEHGTNHAASDGDGLVQW